MVDKVQALIEHFLSDKYDALHFSYDLPDMIVDNYSALSSENPELAKKLDDTFPGKQNGFKCLIYLHRYTPDTVGLIRSDYLTKTQGMIENALKNAEYAINTSSSAVDRAQATKKRDKYLKQLAEIRAYYPALSHIALQRIELDLDDGVPVAAFVGNGNAKEM
jgi:hypothetical protein